MLYTLSQILYLSEIAIFATAQLQKKKSIYMLLFALSDFLFALHYLCLESFSAVIFVGNETLLLIIIFFIQKYGNNKYTILASSLTITADIVACVLTWSTPFILFPFVATTLTCIGMCSKNIVLTKSFACVSVTCSTIYLFIIQSFVAAVVNSCIVLVTIAGLILSIIEANKQNKLKQYNEQQLKNQTPINI